MQADTSIALLGIPSSAGAWATGQEKAPSCLRRNGIVERLKSRGVNLTDAGDAPSVAFRPDHQNPKAQNLDLVYEVALDAAARVDKVVAQQAVPLVLGGGCTISIGVLCGLVKRYQRLGLLYFDGDLDFNTPEVSPSGTLDGMVLSHITGMGSPKLSRIAPRFPLVPEERVAVFGYNPEAGFIDPYEMEALERSAMMRYPASHVREDPLAASREATGRLEKAADHFLLHFDVDAMDRSDFPACDAQHEFGLRASAAVDALRVFSASPKCVGLVVSEFNPDLDSDGGCARKLIDILEQVLG